MRDDDRRRQTGYRHIFRADEGDLWYGVGLLKRLSRERRRQVLLLAQCLLEYDLLEAASADLKAGDDRPGA